MNNLNKQLILDVYTKVFGLGDMAFADSVIAEDYIQHNPLVKTGKAGFMEFLTMLKQLPLPENPKKPFLRLICEDNFVVVHSQIAFMGKENATIEIYRIENGLILEHWDASQEIIDSHPMVVGTLDFDKGEKSSINKKIVEGFVKQVLIRKQFDHTTNVLGDGLKLADFDINYDSLQLHRVLGEQNFVVTQSEFKKAETRSVRYDIYRLSEGLIVEHWSVKQLIPEQMAHSNGMI